MSHLEVNLRIHCGLRAKRSAGVTLRGESEDPSWFDFKHHAESKHVIVAPLVKRT